jgi:hypothetical protein
MGNFVGSKKCSICKKNQATTYRNINGQEYFICNNEKCDFLSKLRAGVLRKRDLSYLNLEIPKIKRR